jgi:hypothetical protein
MPEPLKSLTGVDSVVSSPADDVFYISNADRTQGPFSFKKIRHLWSQGALAASCLIHCGDRWMLLQEFLDPR